MRPELMQLSILLAFLLLHSLPGVRLEPWDFQS